MVDNKKDNEETYNVMIQDLLVCDNQVTGHAAADSRSYVRPNLQALLDKIILFVVCLCVPTLRTTNMFSATPQTHRTARTTKTGGTSVLYGYFFCLLNQIY